MAMLDSLLDDYPLYPSLRIPPLQDPFPDFSAQSARPSPLEPNARVDDNIDDGTAKLSGRRKALAEAKPIGEPTDSTNLRPIQRIQRKRQKLHEHERIADFVQLPQPKAKVKNDKPPPFHPVSVLNELHEPPPSAALFPPITPQDGQSEQERRSPNQIQSPRNQGSTPESKADTVHSSLQNSSPRRTTQRPRKKWSLQETEQLMQGIQIYGNGKWKKILYHPEFSFQPGRTPVDLKDHFRTKMKSANLQTKSSADESLDRASHSSPPLLQHQTNPNENRVTPPEPSRINNRRGTWTEIEDANLEKGYKKHGFCWTDITQDSEFNLSHKTGPQVRDRFRTKFPELYGGDARRNLNRQRSHPKIIQRKGTWTDVEDANLENGYKKHGFSWAKIVNDPELSLTHKTGPQIRDRFRTRFPSLYGEDPRHDPVNRMGRKKKRHEDTSEEPAETVRPARVTGKDNARDSGDAVAGAEEHSAEDKDEMLTQFANNSAESSSKPLALNTGLHNLMGLLNSDVEDDQPSSPLPLDEWDANVTLPPLLWEEMATRPMFDLE